MRSRSSLGSDSKSEKDGSDEAACDAVEGLLVDGLRRRTGRLGDCGGASSMVVSEEPLLPVDERDRDCGVESREAIFCILRMEARISVVLTTRRSASEGWNAVDVGAQNCMRHVSDSSP